MKKILFLLILSLSVVACGDKSEEPETPPPAEQPQDDNDDGGEDDNGGQEPDDGDAGEDGEEGEEGSEEEETPEPENTAPVSSAGSPQTVRYGTLVTLDGSASHDPDGDAITYTWALTAPEGSEAELEGADTAAPTFTTDVPGEYLAGLVVSDGVDDSELATVVITVMQPKRVAFIGGSITGGAGSTDGNSWAEKTEQWLDAYWPEGVEAKNIAIGGTDGRYGVYRMERDLAGFVPDLAFVEYTVNNPIDQEFVHRYVDAIFYKFRALNPDLLQVYVATTAGGDHHWRRDGLEPERVRYSREVSELNRVPFVDAGGALWEEILTSGVSHLEYLPDNTHPNDAGYEIYWQEVKATLEEYLPDAQGEGTVWSHYNASGLAEAGIVPASIITDTDCTLREDGILLCNAGQYFQLVASGEELGFEIRIAPDGGQMECTVDGEPAATINFWDKYSINHTRPHAKMAASGMVDNSHTVRCLVNDTILTQEEYTSKGTMAYIAGVMLPNPQ